MNVHSYYQRVIQRKDKRMEREKVQFQKNQVEEVELAYASGREGENDNGAYFLYTTKDDRVFFATPTLNQKIQALEPKPGTRLQICLRNNRETSGKNQWDVRKVDPPAPAGDGQGGQTQAAAAQVYNRHSNGTSNGNGNGHGYSNGNGNGHGHSNGNGNGHSNGHGQMPAPAGLMTGQSQFCLQQLVAAIEMVHAAEKYAALMGRPISFTSEDVRSIAISCFIQQSRGGR